MNTESEYYLPTRSESGRQNDFLNQKMHTESNRWALQIFKHQPAVFLWDQSASSTESRLAELFYSECYNPPSLTGGLTETALWQTPDSFIEALTRKGDSDRRNVFTYLVGKVGVGKTAFLNYIITTYGREIFNDYKMWFLRVDLEKSYQQDRSRTDVEEDKTPQYGITRKSVLLKIVTKLLNLFRDFPMLYGDVPLVKAALESLRETWADAQRDTDAVFGKLEAEFVVFLKTHRKATGRRLLLIIDNIDFIAHLNDRGLFQQGAGKQQLDHIQVAIDFVHRFVWGSGVFDTLDCSLLLVMREDTKHILNLPSGVSSIRLPPSDVLCTFTLDKVGWDQVLNSRIKLLELGTDVLGKGKKLEMLRIARRMLDNLSEPNRGSKNRQRSIISTIDKISNHGHRGMIEYFGNFALLYPQHGEVANDAISYVTNQRAVAIISFILRNHLFFGQDRCSFPNVYLHNVVDGKNCDHRPTYWLKRLILAFLSRPGRAASPKLILDTFAGDGSQGFYDRNLVEICLGSLADAGVSNLIEMRRDRPQDRREEIIVSELMLNIRGQECSASIFDTFEYLQLVVDDRLLPIPNCLLEDFAFSLQNPTYAYLVSETAEVYQSGAKSMILHKAQTVCLLLTVLDEALDVERMVYSKSFGRLQKAGVQIPNTHTIRAKVMAHIVALFRHYKLGDPQRLVDYALKKRAAISADISNACSFLK